MSAAKGMGTTPFRDVFGYARGLAAAPARRCTIMSSRMVGRSRCGVQPRSLRALKLDDKALYGHNTFLSGLGDGGGGRRPALRQFVEARRRFLLANKSLAKKL